MPEFVNCKYCVNQECAAQGEHNGYILCDMYAERPLSNADRIRAMTDEELAKERIIRKFGLFVAIDEPDIYFENKEEAVAAELAWLKSDAEERKEE